MLGDLSLRNALKARKDDLLEVHPGPQEDGWHLVEVFPNALEGLVTDSSPWVNQAMAQNTDFIASEEDKQAILRSGSAHFDGQLDALLEFLRAARDAVSMWPIQ